MIATIAEVPAGDVLLLHGCCHNPTGEDPTREQWMTLAQLCQERKIVPFIDLVYQGFGDGIDEDVFGTRLMTTQCDEAILVTSASKSFGIYRDRAGTISLLARDSGRVANIERHLAQIASGLYFMPPDFGAALVAEILGDAALREQWKSELSVMRQRIADLRITVADLFKRRLQGWDWDFLGRQKGMFSLLPLSPDDIARLRVEHGVYMMPDARINLAALTAEKAERVVDAIADVLSATVRA
jgi:aspartate/tyrosine/aromatic aminotransferase